MTDDRQARLDRAITEARRDVVFCASKMTGDDKSDGWRGNVNLNLAIDRYTALAALRAKIDEAELHCEEQDCERRDDLERQAERLLGEDA